MKARIHLLVAKKTFLAFFLVISLPISCLANTGTFTMLDAIQEKWCTFDSKVYVIDDLLDQLFSVKASQS